MINNNETRIDIDEEIPDISTAKNAKDIYLNEL